MVDAEPCSHRGSHTELQKAERYAARYEPELSKLSSEVSKIIQKCCDVLFHEHF